MGIVGEDACDRGGESMGVVGKRCKGDWGRRLLLVRKAGRGTIWRFPRRFGSKEGRWKCYIESVYQKSHVSMNQKIKRMLTK